MLKWLDRLVTLCWVMVGGGATLFAFTFAAVIWLRHALPEAVFYEWIYPAQIVPLRVASIFLGAGIMIGFFAVDPLIRARREGRYP